MTLTWSSAAVATIARSSASVSSGAPWTMRPGARPVVVSIAASDATTLTTSAPSRTTRRVAVTSASGPSASTPNAWPCPPVIPTADAGHDQARPRHLPGSDRVAQDDLEVADRPGAAGAW